MYPDILNQQIQHDVVIVVLTVNHRVDVRDFLAIADIIQCNTFGR